MMGAHSADSGVPARAEIRLLGGFSVVVDGRPVPDDAWQRRSASALVKLLALQPQRRLHREQVIDALWPDLLVDAAVPRLHKAAHYARKALGARDSVVLAAETLSLLPGAVVTVDVAEFDRAAEAALADAAPESAAAAADRYAGDLLPEDRYEAWAEEPRRALRLRHLELLRAAGRWRAALAVDPLDEDAWLNLVREHVQAGRRQPALRALDRMAEVWQRELGRNPGAAAGALRRQALALPVVGPGHGPAPRVAPVPVPPTPTVGREDDIVRVCDLLGRARIVTLLGPGGVGKTRLAVEAALRVAGGRGEDVCFVDLSPVSDPRLVADTVGRALGLRVGAGASAEPALAEALRARSVLLLVDNFEHVLDTAGLVSRLIAGAPGLRVLATSRARLRVAGEHLYEVAPLPVRPAPAGGPDAAAAAPAVALFRQVASAADPDFDLARHLPDVVAICAQVDGLPLAIELAAGHVRTLPPVLLRARLAARLGAPTAGPRNSHPRQRTIPATIDWSLQLVGPAERRLFARLGVFAGAVSLEAVEQVCRDESADVVDPLSRLVDQSLVRRTTNDRGEPRFGLLELLRERARALLGEDPAGEDVRRRHAGWIADVTEVLDEQRWTDAGGPWLDRLGELLPEIRVAHEWACRADRRTAARITAALGIFWHRGGQHLEGRAWVADAFAHAEELTDDLLAARLHLTAGLVEWTRDLVVARDHWDAAAAAFRRFGHDRYLACALAWSALTHVGDPATYDQALQRSDEAVALARTVGEPPVLGHVLNNKGELARVHGDLDLALAAYEESLGLAVGLGDRIAVSVVLTNLGHVAAVRGRSTEARGHYLEALALAWSLGRRPLAAWDLCLMAGPEADLGRPEHAARLVGAGEQALRVLQATLYPGDRAQRDRVVRGLRETLGNEDFQRLSAEGERLSLDEAVALALGDAETAGLPLPRRPGDEERPDRAARPGSIR
jgi:predicted ATPase/DNA-binding SARP family transcriptional activator